jgi:signal transduction histidine kinase
MKLAAALAVPLLALFVRTGVEVADRAREVAELRSQAALARAAVGPGGLINRLQDESTWTVIDLTGATGGGVHAPVESYEATRRATDEALAGLRAEVESGGEAVAAAYARALDGLAEIDRIRADVDADRASSPLAGTSGNIDFSEQVFQRYASLTRPFFDATDEVVASIDDARLRRGAELVNTASRDIQQYVDMARHVLISGTSDGGLVDERTEIREATVRKEQWDAYNGQLTRARAPYDRIVAATYPYEFVAGFTELAERSLRGEAIPVDELIAPMAITDWGGLTEFRQALSDEVTATGDHIADDAQQRQRLFVATAGLTLLGAVVLTWVVSRSITVPLRSLTHQATLMATERLPAAVLRALETPPGEGVRVPAIEPVRVATHDEVIDVADALNAVQETAIDLAVEQALLRRNVADTFVSLGRRNQGLIVRQIDMITQLEAVETDADALADLFRLDHLATRMRRNAESLLVLAGTEPPRQWATPVRVGDVLRAALGEVEDFQRVALREVEPAFILGSAAADLAHLLAELVENGLVFSPADRLVDVRGRRASGGRYALAVIDRGVGMDAMALAEANRRLARAESFAVAPSKYLGHYVAGQLAARHGIRVHLAPSAESRGVVAIVDLPAALLVHPRVTTTAPPAPPRAPRLARRVAGLHRD